MKKRSYIRYATSDKLKLVNINNTRYIEEYFIYKGEDLSSSTKKGYQSDFNQWLVYIQEFYDNQDLLQMNVDDTVDMIEDWISFCISVFENNERRMYRRVSSISSFYQYLRKNRKIKENPIDYLDSKPRLGKGEKSKIKNTFLTRDEIEKIRRGLKQIGEVQLELFFEFGLSTMAMANEISNIKIDQINFESGVVQSFSEKGVYKSTLFPSRKCMRLISKWIGERDSLEIDNEYLFLARYKGEWNKVKTGTLQSSWIKKIGRIIEEPELHCYDLRHSGSSLLHDAGVPLETIGKLLNYKSISLPSEDYYLNYDEIQKEKNKFDI